MMMLVRLDGGMTVHRPLCLWLNLLLHFLPFVARTVWSWKRSCLRRSRALVHLFHVGTGGLLRRRGRIARVCRNGHVVRARRRLCSRSWRGWVLDGRWDLRWRQLWRRGRYWLGLFLSRLDVPQLLEQDVGHLHRHAAEVGHQVRAGGVAGEAAFWNKEESAEESRRQQHTAQRPT
jgi:hypothetical protein